MKPGYETVAGKKATKKLAFVQLKASAKHAKNRFAPSNLAREAADKAHDVGEVILEEGMDIAKTYKWPLLGIGTLAGLFLARKPIAKFVKDIRDEE